MIDTNSVKVRVKGEYACFTQPALKVERITYPSFKNCLFTNYYVFQV